MKSLLKALIFIVLNACCGAVFAIDYTWGGTISSDWATATNWAPNGIPGAGDNVTIVTGPNQPALDMARSVTNFTINSGTLNLNTFTLTVTGTATYTAGAINNGTIASTGTTTTFAGTAFGAIVNATSQFLNLNGSTFNNTVNLTKTGASDILCNGGNVFNAPATINNTGSAFLALANLSPDIFNDVVTFNNSGTDEIHAAYNAVGSQFNGDVTFNNSATGGIISSHGGLGASVAYNGNIIVNNASPAGIYLGFFGGTATLADTRTISTTGYSAGVLLIGYMTQLGTTPQALTLTGTGFLYVGPSSVFNADVNFSAPQLALDGTTYNGTATLSKTGATDNLGQGGNTFNGITSITNSGSGYLALGNAFPDIFNANVTFTNSGTNHLLIALNSAGNEFNGDATYINTSTGAIFNYFGTLATAAYNENIIVNNTSAGTAGVYFGGLGGTATLAATKTVSIGGTGFATGVLLLGFMNVASAQSLTLSGTTMLEVGPSSTFNGNVSFISPQIELNGNTFNGTVYAEKTGATQSNSLGGNVFNSTATLVNSSNAFLVFGFPTGVDIFNDDLTVTNSGTAATYLAYNTAGHQFNGNVALNSTSGTGIFFGAGTGTSTLANTRTLSVGGSGFLSGTLGLTRFTQAGTTAQTLVLTGSALMQIGVSTTFNGNVNFTAPQLEVNSSTFNGTALLTKNGATTNTSTGGNTFNGIATIANSGSGSLDLADTSPDTFNDDLFLNNSGTSRIQIGISSAGNVFNGDVTINHGGNTSGLNTIIGRNAGATATVNGNLTLNCTNSNTGSGIIIANDGTATVNGNITVSSTSGRGVLFGAASGTVTLGNGFTITDAGAGTFTTGTLTLRRFMQTGGTAQNFTLTGTSNLTIANSSQFNGAVDFTAPQLFLNGCTFNSTAALTKSGATDNTSTGGNVFNSTTTITNSGSGILRLANATADDFNGDVTFVRTGTGAFQPAYGVDCTFSGNIAVNAAARMIFGGGAGMATLDGANPQTISKGGAANPAFNRLRINKASNDVTLSTPINVLISLTFVQQSINSDAVNLVIVGDNATHSGVSNTSHVIGPLRKVGNDAFTFPVGKNGFYRPISISAPAVTTDHFTAEYFEDDPDASYSAGSLEGTIDHVSRCEYWILDRTNGTSDVSVTLSWDTNSCGVDNLPELLVSRWDGAMWVNHGNGGTTGTTTSGTIVTSGAVTSFSPITLASSTSNNPLPVELLNFSAMPNGNAVDIKWSTASELNNEQFIVERTVNGEVFESVDVVEGAGTSTSIRSYYTRDHYPLKGTSYYRLTQVDFDGEQKRSKLVAVEFHGSLDFSFSLFPNPSQSETNLTFSGIADSKSAIQIAVFDLNGQQLLSHAISVKELQDNIATIELGDGLPTGVYTIVARNGFAAVTQRLVVMR